ncbi:MAG: sensor histidine kinase [Nonomuraea sp.]|nr:sensor histidine kinase [Nonomuraea sp.]
MSRLRGGERLLHTVLAYGLLAVSVLDASLTGDQPDAADALTSVAPWIAVPWPVLAAVAAVWLAFVPWLHPRRERLPALVVLHYTLLVGLAAALVAADPAFTVFASLGYPLAVALLPTRLVMAGVTLTAVAVVVSQAGPAAPAGLFTVAGGIAVPLVLAGWYVSAESDKRRRLIGDLRTAMDENAGLHARLLDQARRAGVLDERHRMAGEIHDTVAQDLVVLIRRLAAAGSATGEEERRRHLAQATRLARQSLTEARRSVRALRPEALEDARLPDALGRMAGTWANTTGVHVAVEVTGTPVALAADVEATLFRIAQEALANVAKHADASRAALTLSYTDEVVMLDIRDDGRGFEPQAAADGFGLEGMRRRARGLGGTLEVESEPGRGSAVAAIVPVIPAEGEAT